MLQFLEPVAGILHVAFGAHAQVLRFEIIQLRAVLRLQQLAAHSFDFLDDVELLGERGAIVLGRVQAGGEAVDFLVESADSRGELIDILTVQSRLQLLFGGCLGAGVESAISQFRFDTLDLGMQAALLAGQVGHVGAGEGRVERGQHLALGHAVARIDPHFADDGAVEGREHHRRPLGRDDSPSDHHQIDLDDAGDQDRRQQHGDDHIQRRAHETRRTRLGDLVYRVQEGQGILGEDVGGAVGDPLLQRADQAADAGGRFDDRVHFMNLVCCCQR